MNSPAELEKLIEAQTRDAPPDMARLVIEAVRLFIADPDSKVLTIAKVEGDGKTHYLIDIS